MRRTEAYRLKMANAERYALQKEIEEKFGSEKIQEARKCLCTRCSRVQCLLLPIISEGKDCPYFKEVETKG